MPEEIKIKTVLRRRKHLNMPKRPVDKGFYKN